MDGSVVAALIASPLTLVGVLVAAVLNQRGERKLEHQAAWRKIQLESYQEYFSALSESRVNLDDAKALSRYRAAADSLALVALPGVLKEFYAYQNASTEIRTIQTPTAKQIDALNAQFYTFVRRLREDCHPPDSPRVRNDFKFQLFNFPAPRTANNAEKPSLTTHE